MISASFKAARSETLQLWLECDLIEVRPVALAVSSFLRDQMIGEETVQACELALVEACNNAVRYALEEGRKEPVQVDVICGSEQIELRVSDHTPGFDLPSQVELPSPEHESGRGLFLIQSVMDAVRYLRGREGNCLVMKKKRPAVLRAAAASASGLDDVNRKLVESEQIISDMAEELSFCYESLSAIFRCSADLGKTQNLEEFSQRLLMDLSQISSADWFLLRVVAKEDSRLVVFTASEPGLQLMPLMLAPTVSGCSVEVEAALTGQDVWFDEQRPLERTDPLGAVKTECIGLVHPFFAGDALIGTLTVGKRKESPHFTAVHANVIHTFADFLAIQIVNARFQEEQFATRIVSRELEIAKNIQRSLLPKALPHLPGYTLAGYCESARQVGGDFYDVLRINDHAVLLIIADVMGKGIPAAIFAAILRSVLRAVPEWTTDPAALLSRVNRLLYEELSGVDMFITAQLVFVDTRERRLVAASAGHCPTLLSNGRTGSVKALSPEGLPLGILSETTFSSQTEELGKQHRVLLYTDGLTEARNAMGEFYGQDRLLRWFQQNGGQCKTAEELKCGLAAELERFQGNSLLNDDQTFLVLAT